MSFRFGEAVKSVAKGSEFGIRTDASTALIFDDFTFPANPALPALN